VTPEGQAKLIEHEDEVLHAYQDSLGWWTIGVGHLIDKRKGGSIPQRISRLLLVDDIAVKTAECRAAFDWFDDLDETRKDAIVNLAFNLGTEGLKGFPLFIAAMVAQDWKKAAFELWNSQWARQVQKTRVDDITGAIEYGVWD